MRTLGARVCSKAARSGQWAALALAAAALSMAACSRHSEAQGDAASPSGGRPTPSGLPVPRYVSLKFDKVYARGGPGEDYDMKWVYRAKGLPLQVVAETEEWRRVCDADGSLSWVHRRTTDARRTVMRVQPQPLALHARPDGGAPETAILLGRAIADLRQCKGGWCQLAVGHASGWAPGDQVWGVAAAPQCR